MTELHHPLPTDAYLRLFPEACLAVRGGAAACAACAGACPAGVLAVDHEGPRLAGNCLHCGRCAAACPSGALMAQGFEEAVLPNGDAAIMIECWKVPAKLVGPHGVRVPCLGGLPLYRLLEWQRAVAPRRLVFVDRAWCGHCQAGGDDFAAQALLAEAQALLGDCGVPAAQQPTRVSRPLPAEHMPAAIPSAASQIAMGRRAFFGRLGREIARSERPVAPPSGPRAALRRCPLPARERQLVALDELARTNGCCLPARALPAVSVGPGCRDHGLCAGLCPTGALSRTDDGTGIALEFEASRCVACGRCARHCPEAALTLSPSGGEPERVEVKRHAIAVCLECGRSFARADTAQKICGQCESRRDLARNLFGHE